MKNDRLEKIKKIIEEKYLSLNSPKFFFVQEASENKIYEPIIKKISKEFVVEETTDLNDDVSFCYLIKGLDDKIFLQLSMLGPYYIIVRIHDLSKNTLVSKENCSKEEGKIISIIDEIGLEMLTKIELETHVALNLYICEPKDVCIYHALFSDGYFFPWS